MPLTCYLLNFQIYNEMLFGRANEKVRKCKRCGRGGHNIRNCHGPIFKSWTPSFNLCAFVSQLWASELWTLIWMLLCFTFDLQLFLLRLFFMVDVLAARWRQCSARVLTVKNKGIFVIMYQLLELFILVFRRKNNFELRKNCRLRIAPPPGA